MQAESSFRTLLCCCLAVPALACSQPQDRAEPQAGSRAAQEESNAAAPPAQADRDPAGDTPAKAGKPLLNQPGVPPAWPSADATAPQGPGPAPRMSRQDDCRGPAKLCRADSAR